MNLLTAEWAEKAKGDFITVQREYRARKMPVYDTACFHCQQCVEKYLKAHLHENSLPIPKTHDLRTLLVDLARLDPLWATFQTYASQLTAYAVQFRYPGSSADRIDAKEAIVMYKAIRKYARQLFGLT